MPQRQGPVHVVTTERKYKGQTYRTHLLRRSFRMGGKVRNETLGNLSHLPDHLIDLVRRSLKGETFLPAAERFEITRSLAHGHIQAVRTAMDRLGFDSLLASRRSPERDLVCAMVAARIVSPHTKLATTRWWETTTAAADFEVSGASEDDLYGAMDWLLGRQGRIERKLAERHLKPGGLVLYDLSSSYFEGTTCPLAKLGHNRDGKKGKLQVNYGLTTDRRGCPVAISVFPGNVADSESLSVELERLRAGFGIDRLVLVGDRGMISQRAIDEELREKDGLGWITALKTVQIRGLVEGGVLQLGLFDQRNLLEFTHPTYPGERLIACRNEELGRLRAHKRRSLIEATSRELEKIGSMVERGRLKGQVAIAERLGKVKDKYKVAKHFDCEVTDASFRFTVNEERVAAEAKLDGIYVIRTSLRAREMGSEETVRSYKSLAQVERAFRSMKTVDLKVRPIHHRLEDRVRSHIFLCMLAYYVEWHMREALRPMLFADEEVERKATRDPVAPAQRSFSAHRKATTRRCEDGTPAHSFSTLLQELSGIVRNLCRVPGSGESEAAFQVTTTPSDLQRRALDLVGQIRP